MADVLIGYEMQGTRGPDPSGIHFLVDHGWSLSRRCNGYRHYFVMDIISPAQSAFWGLDSSSLSAVMPGIGMRYAFLSS